MAGFCHLLDAVESEVKHSTRGQPVNCYVEDSSELPTGVYHEIVEFVLLKIDHYVIFSFEIALCKTA